MKPESVNFEQSIYEQYKSKNEIAAYKAWLALCIILGKIGSKNSEENDSKNVLKKEPSYTLFDDLFHRFQNGLPTWDYPQVLCDLARGHLGTPIEIKDGLVLPKMPIAKDLQGNIMLTNRFKSAPYSGSTDLWLPNLGHKVSI